MHLSSYFKAAIYCMSTVLKIVIGEKEIDERYMHCKLKADLLRLAFHNLKALPAVLYFLSNT